MTAVLAAGPAPAAARDGLVRASEHHEQASALVDQGRYGKALEHAEQALDLRRAVLGQLHADVAASVQLRAMVRYHMGEHQAALEGLKDALSIVEGLAEPAAAGLALGILRDLIWVSMEGGQMDEAGALLALAQSRAEAAKGDEHEVFADLLNHEATWLQRRGRLEEALPVQARALTLRERRHGPMHWSVGQSLNNLAIIELDLGAYEPGLRLLQRALTIFEAHFGGQHAEVAHVLSTLASAYWDLGRLGDALAAAERALAIDLETDGERHAAIAQSQSLVAVLLRDLGRRNEALALQHRARERFEKHGLQSDRYYAVILNNIGGLLTARGEFDAARAWLEQSLAIKRRVVGPTTPTVAVTLRALAALHLRTGSLDEAAAAFAQALAISGASLGASHPAVAASLDGLAEVDLRRGAVDAALQRLARAERMATAAGMPQLQWRVQDRLRQGWSQAGQPALAIFWGKQAAATLQAVRSGLIKLNTNLQESFLADKRPVYTGLAELLIDAERLVEAQQVLALQKEEELYDFLGRAALGGAQSPGILPGTASEGLAEQVRQGLRRRFDDLRHQRASLQRRAKAGDAAARAALAELDAAWRTVESDYDTWAEGLRTALRSARPAAPDDAASSRRLAQDEQTAMLHYVLRPAKVSIIVTTRLGQVVRESVVHAAEVQRLVLALRTAVQARRDVAEPAQLLHRWLIEPVLDDVRQAGVTHLAMSLDGVLRYLPFSALHDGRHWLAERFAISVLTQAGRSDLTRVPPGEWSFAGLGLTRAVSGFDALPAVRRELEGIRDRVLPGEIWLDEAFTAARLERSLSEGAPVLHVASHFEFRPGTEADSFLMLGDGNRLTLKQIRERRLDFGRLELLTLSACDTAMGGGEDENGVEIEGLGALAQRQGARAVLATLWPVADSSSATFMQTLYSERTRQRKDKAGALRAAQKALMSERRTAHPYFWAAFVLMGNWR